MRDLITTLLGEYTPTVGEDGTFIGGLASIDFTWIVGAVCFIIMLLGVISLLRVLLKSIL